MYTNNTIFNKKTESKPIDYTIKLKKESDTTEWANWSTTIHTEDEIREKCLTDYNNVCFTYVCNKSPISEDFILEFAVLSMGILNKDNYKENIKKLKKMMGKHLGLEEYKGIRSKCTLIPAKFYSGYNGKEITLSVDDLFDKLDWVGLSQNSRFSEEFLYKFSQYIELKNISLSQLYSKDVIKRFSKYKEAHEQLD